MNGATRAWTRADFEWLVAEGKRLLDEVTSTNALPRNQESVRAWLNQVEAWMNAGISTSCRAAIDRASDRMRRYYVSRTSIVMVGNWFDEDLRDTIEEITTSASAFRFAPPVADDDFLEFLRTAKHEDAKLHMGEALTVELIAKRAGLTLAVANACVQRATVEELIYRHTGEPETNLYLELEDVDFAIARLGRKGASPIEDAEERSVKDEALSLGPRPRVVSLLGSGAEADVYLVEDRFGRQVAAKVFYESKRVPEHIYGHAVGLARVPHPAVATLYTIDEVVLDGKLVPAILMELLVGEELEMRLRREVSVQELIDWGRTLLDVFAAMHAVDHFHPDPHPGNFFVTDRGVRLYDVLRSLTAENRSTGTKDSMRSNNARRVREIIEAIFDKLPISEAAQAASRAFTSKTRSASVTLQDVRRAFGESVEALVGKQ
jgi:hypothetical protein